MSTETRRFQIEKLEDRISPALLTIDPSAVGGAVQGAGGGPHVVPDQAAAGLETAGAVTPSDLVTLVKGQ